MSVYTIGNTCGIIICNVLNDVSKCYYVAEMDEIKYQYLFLSNKAISHLLATSYIKTFFKRLMPI
jgi:hypothetical protein